MSNPIRLHNGPGAAAILSAGIGAGALGLFALAADAFAAVRRVLLIWPPSGPLSGVTTAAILVWLVAWVVLSRRWATRDVSLARVNLVAFALLALGLLLTFPPFMDLLQGK
jgi:hypothetical protein